MVLENIGKSYWKLLEKSCDIGCQYKCGQILKEFKSLSHDNHRSTLAIHPVDLDEECKLDRLHKDKTQRERCQ